MKACGQNRVLSKRVKVTKASANMEGYSTTRSREKKRRRQVLVLVFTLGWTSILKHWYISAVGEEVSTKTSVVSAKMKARLKSQLEELTRMLTLCLIVNL